MPVRLQSRKPDFERARRCRNRLWHFYPGVSTKAAVPTSGPKGRWGRTQWSWPPGASFSWATGWVVAMDVRRKPDNRMA